MRTKEERLLITFATTTGAMAMEKVCQKMKAPGRLIPVPRSITSGCGLCWSAPTTARATIEKILVEKKLDADGIYIKEIYV